MLTQRDIDLFHVEAQEYSQQIVQEFQQTLAGNRAMRGKPPQPQQPMPVQQPQQPMTPEVKNAPTY